MPRGKPSVAPEVKQEILERVNAGESVSELGRIYDVPAQYIYNWRHYEKSKQASNGKRSNGSAKSNGGGISVVNEDCKRKVAKLSAENALLRKMYLDLAMDVTRSKDTQ